MRAVEVTQIGGPEVLVARETADPVAGPGQALIAVAVADVLFLEAQLRGGWGREYFAKNLPYVPGTGVAGTVRAVGAGVDPAWIGRRVVARTDDGGYAELAVAAADGLVAVPDGLGLAEAAALLQVGPAALRLVDRAALEPGERVLVTAAAGGLGTLLVQLAKAAGATVIAAARGARKLELARDLGADTTVDYSEADWPAQVGRVDVVFDGVGGQVGAAAFELTARGGRVFAYGVPSGGFAEIDPAAAQQRAVSVFGIDQVQFTVEEGRELAERALSAAVAGQLLPVIGQTFPLAMAADAHAAVEARSVLGKVLLLV